MFPSTLHWPTLIKKTSLAKILDMQTCRPLSARFFGVVRWRDKSWRPQVCTALERHTTALVVRFLDDREPGHFPGRE
jgi:hypothetical protein